MAAASAASPPLRHQVWIVLLFLGGMAAACGLLGRSLPFPEVPVVWEKLEKLKRSGDEYDILFIGSSRVHFQVMPSIFDGLIHERWAAAKSFNAGVAAIRPPEDCYYLDQVLRCPHRRLRWVFLEIMPVRLNGDPILMGTDRYTYWRDWERTRMLTDGFLAECAGAWTRLHHREASWPETIQSWSRSLGVWLDNLRLFAVDGCHVGRGATWLSRKMDDPKKRKRESRINDKRWAGWNSPNIERPISGSAKRLTDYQRSYASLLDMKDRFDAGDQISVEALRRKLDRLREAGVTPILIIPPAAVPKRFYPYALAGGGVDILDFSDPREYPEFFSVDHRLDANHLNDAGAELFTKALAKKFLEILGRPGAAP